MRKNCLDYPVEIVENSFEEGNATLADMLRKISGDQKPRVMLVADQNVVAHTDGLGSRIGHWMQANGIELAGAPMIVTGGERAKGGDLTCANEIAHALVKAKVGMHDAVLVIGGGTILDVTGWAAAQVRGGVPVVRMPTTPSAMIDGAFAEYAAVNSSGVKDALRVSCKPAGVIIDTNFMSTVLDGVWRAGFAEAMRLALVSDASLVKKLVAFAPQVAAREPSAMKEMIELTVAVRRKKGSTGFAIWAAHRLEAMSGYKLPHGYAVALGIEIDTHYAVMKGALREDDRKMISDALVSSGVAEGAFRSRHLLGNSDLVILGLDAWRLGNGTGNIVIPAGIGKGIEENPDRDTMKQAINLLK